MGNTGSNSQQAPCMYRETLEGPLSIVPHLQPAPREGKVPAKMPHQDSSSPAKGPASHSC